LHPSGMLDVTHTPAGRFVREIAVCTSRALGSGCNLALEQMSSRSRRERTDACIPVWLESILLVSCASESVTRNSSADVGVRNGLAVLA
jgi:hypothetical protein